MANTYTSLTYHIVFSTKYRQKILLPEIESELYKYIGGIIKGNDSQPLEIGGTADHIHILTGITPKLAVSDMVRDIKANSSNWVNQHHPGRRSKFGWQVGYAAFTVSKSQFLIARRYIQNQKEHHRKISFYDEYLMLLRKHGIEFDLKYVFDEEKVG